MQLGLILLTTKRTESKVNLGKVHSLKKIKKLANQSTHILTLIFFILSPQPPPPHSPSPLLLLLFLVIAVVVVIVVVVYMKRFRLTVPGLIIFHLRLYQSSKMKILGPSALRRRLWLNVSFGGIDPGTMKHQNKLVNPKQPFHT